MNLSAFVNRDIWTFLQGFRPLAGWEQLHIVYHSCLPLRDKREAYETLLAEFSGDSALVGHLRRNINKLDYALGAPDRETIPGHIFIARSYIEKIYDNYFLPPREYSSGSEFFSSYQKAKRWTDDKREDARKHCDTIRCFDHIIEYELDTKRQIFRWNLDGNGLVRGFDDDDTNDNEENACLPEARDVNLPGVFAPGDILLMRSVGWPHIHNGSGFGVVDFGDVVRVQETEREAAESNAWVGVMCFDSDEGTVWEDGWPVLYAERFEGELPSSQAILNNISHHFKGEKSLDADEIKRLDPNGFIVWDKERLIKFHDGTDRDYGNVIFIDMIRDGYILYLNNDEPDCEPHFHIMKKGDWGAYHTCIKMRSAEYYHHKGMDEGKQHMLGYKMRSILQKRLSADRWMRLIMRYNQVHGESQMSLTTPIPNYDKLEIAVPPSKVSTHEPMREENHDGG